MLFRSITAGDAGPERAVDVNIGKHGVHVSPGHVQVGDGVDVEPGKVHVGRDGVPSSDDMAKLIDAAMKEAQAEQEPAPVKRPAQAAVALDVERRAKELRTCGGTKQPITVTIERQPDGSFDVDATDIDPSTLPPQQLAALECAGEKIARWLAAPFDGEPVSVQVPLKLGK